MPSCLNPIIRPGTSLEAGIALKFVGFEAAMVLLHVMLSDRMMGHGRRTNHWQRGVKADRLRAIKLRASVDSECGHLIETYGESGRFVSWDC